MQQATGKYVLSDIVKDTAIFKAHQAVPIVVATEDERRFDPYADAVIRVPEVKERFAPIINTLAGHMWGYYAALGGKYHHIKHLVEETSLAWRDEYLDLLEIEQLFGMSAEKIAETISSTESCTDTKRR